MNNNNNDKELKEQKIMFSIFVRIKKAILIGFCVIVAIGSFLIFESLYYAHIEGIYYSFPQQKLNKVNIEFSLFKDGVKTNSYKVKLGKNGQYKFKINEAGEYYLMVTGTGFPSYLWEQPIFSDSSLLYFYNFEKGHTIKLPPQYISEAIKIILPSKDRVYSIKNLKELVFAFKKNPFADFYDMNIFKVKEGGNELMISIHKIRNEIKYREIEKTKVIDRKKDFDSMIKDQMFNTQFKPLEAGKYTIEITAYKALIEEKQFLIISSTNVALENYFYVKN